MKGDQTKAEWKQYKHKGPTWGVNARFFEFGVMKKNSDDPKTNLMQEQLIAVKTAIKKGARRDEVFDISPAVAVKHENWVEREISRVMPLRRLDLKVYLFIGEGGTNKSRFAWDIGEGHGSFYSVPIQQNKSAWFDGYDGQKVVLFEDYSGQLPLSTFLRLLDIYPVQVPIKRSHIWFEPEHILITTNIHPKDWYRWDNREKQRRALRRRIHVVRDFDDTWIPDGLDYAIGTELQVEDFWYV